MSRKIISMCVTPMVDGCNPSQTIVCDDGTAWERYFILANDEWRDWIQVLPPTAKAAPIVDPPETL